MHYLETFLQFITTNYPTLSHITQKNYRADIRKFIAWYESSKGVFIPSNITTTDIEAFEKACLENGTVASLSRYKSSLKLFFNYLSSQSIIMTNPFASVYEKEHTIRDPYSLNQFKNQLYLESSSHLTVKNYLIDIKQFLYWAEEVRQKTGSQLLTALTPELVEEYKKRLLTESVFSPATINRKLSSLRRYTAWLNIDTTKPEFSQPKVKLQPKEATAVEAADILAALPEHVMIPEGKKVASKSVKKLSKFPPIRVFQQISALMSEVIDVCLVGPAIQITHGLRRKRKVAKVALTGFVTKPQQFVRNLPKRLYSPISVSVEGLPWYKQVVYHVLHTRPEWFRRYQKTAAAQYFNFLVLLIFGAIVAVGIYTNFIQNPQNNPTLAAQIAPLRILSFQGRLTDTNDNPTTSQKWVRFIIYNDSSASGSARLWEEDRQVTPDSDGIFSVLLGSNGSGGAASLCNGNSPPSSPATGSCGIMQTLFAQNQQLYLGVTIENTPELTPRQQLATVSFATNSEMLQGLPPTTDTTDVTNNTNAVLALNGSGTVDIQGTATATTIQYTGNQFNLIGKVLSLQTVSGTGTNIQLNPDGRGQIDVQKPLINSTRNGNMVSGLTSLVTDAGAVEVDGVFGVLATSSGQSAFTVNQNSTGPVISASVSGLPVFTLDGNGNGTFSNNITGNTIFTGGGTTYYINNTTSNLNALNLASNLNVSGNITGPSTGIVGYWQRNLNAVSPTNITDDVLIGATATTSAKFAFLNNFASSNSDPYPVASFSATNKTAKTGLVLGTDGSIQSLLNSNLTLGGTTTGNIILQPLNGSGYVGIDTANPNAPLQVNGNLTETGQTALGNSTINSSAAFQVDYTQGSDTTSWTGGNFNTRSTGSLSTNLTGIRSFIQLNGSGKTIADARNFEAVSPTVTAGTITNAYGLYINQQSVSGVTNGWGVYQTNSSDKNYFAGNFGIGTNTTPALLNVSGTNIGKPLVILNETGTNDIISASVGGVLKARLDSSAFWYTSKFIDIDNNTFQYYVDPASSGSSASLAGSLTFSSNAAHNINYTDNSNINFQRYLNGDGGTASSTLYLANSGNVGIGTTSPNQSLSIGVPNGTNTQISFINPTTDSTHIEWDLSKRSDNNQFWLYGYNGTTFWNPIKADYTNKYLNLVPDGTGSVGIGTTTPQTSLNLTTGDTLQVGLNTDSFYTQLGTNALSLNRAGNISYVQQSGVGGALAFRVSNVTADDTTAMYIASSGNVGIGSTSPNQLLHLYSTGTNDVAMQYETNNASTIYNTPVASASAMVTSTDTNCGSSAITWTNPTNIGATDGNDATYAFTAAIATGRCIKGTNLGFNINGSATILGIQAVVMRNKATNVSTVTDFDMQLAKAGSPVGSNKADTSTGYTTTMTPITYGSNSDLWGTTWSPSDFNNSNFGFEFATQNKAATAVTVQVDAIAITVYYRDPSVTSGIQQATGLFKISNSNALGTNDSVILNPANGRIGINTTSANGVFEVRDSVGQGGGGSSSTLGIRELLDVTNNNGEGAGVWYDYVNNIWINRYYTNSHDVTWNMVGTEYMRLSAGGEFFINAQSESGTPSTNHKLYVNGVVVANGFNGACISTAAFSTNGTSTCNRDIAEVYSSDEVVSPGDLLSTSDSTNSNVKKSAMPYDPSVLGIVSTQPGLILGYNDSNVQLGGPTNTYATSSASQRNPAVALNGRVPANVSTENGFIHRGDYMTSSSLPGVAMKATKAGRVIGIALEDFDATQAATMTLPSGDTVQTEKLMIFVNPSWYDPDVYLTDGGNLSIMPSVDGLADHYTVSNQDTPVDRIGAFAEAAIGHLRAGFIETQNLTTNSLAISTNNITIAGQSLNDYIINVVRNNLPNQAPLSPLASAENIKTDLISPLSQNSHISVSLDNSSINIHSDTSSTSAVVAQINNTGDATFAGTLNPKNLAVNQDATISGTLYVDKIKANEIEGLDAKLSTLSAQSITNVTNIYFATPSATPTPDELAIGQTVSSTSSAGVPTPQLGYVDIASQASFLAYVPNLQTTAAFFSQGITSSGTTNLADTNVSGELAVQGTLILANNSVNVLGSAFEIQPLRQGGINFEGGLIAMDTNGNIDITGNATVHGVLVANIISPLPNQDLAINLATPQSTSASQLKVTNASGSAVLAINNTGDITASGTGTFNKIQFNLVSPAYALSDTEAIATGSAGTANILPYHHEITIDNVLVTDKSLIYITPVGDTGGQIPYLERQVPGASFTVGTAGMANIPVQFNWLILN